MDAKTYAAAFLLLVLLAAVYFSHTLAPAKSPPEKQAQVVVQSEEAVEEIEPVCIDGKKELCAVSGGCPGERICIGGQWSGCIKKAKVCEPNSTIACPYDECRFGVAVCGPCASGYGKCELRECDKNVTCSGKTN